jgi:hypothetical protein
VSLIAINVGEESLHKCRPLEAGDIIEQQQIGDAVELRHGIQSKLPIANNQ